MAQFSVNTQRFDPYKNFKFRVKWDGKYVAGVSKISALKPGAHQLLAIMQNAAATPGDVQSDWLRAGGCR